MNDILATVCEDQGIDLLSLYKRVRESAREDAWMKLTPAELRVIECALEVAGEL